MNKILPLSEIDPDFPEFIEGYQVCLENAFADFKKLQDFRNDNLDALVLLNNYIKCGLIQQYFWAYATEYFKDSDKVKIGMWKNVEGAVLNNKWLIRFNKIDKRGRIGGINTPQKEDFMRQQAIEGLPDGLTYVFSGYDPDDGWINAKGVYFAKWNSPTENDWIYKVGERFEEQKHINFQQEEQKTKKSFTPRKPKKGDDKTGTSD